MTIDEAYEIVEDEFAQTNDDMLSTLYDAIEELKWWRKQDLIRREDVLNVYNSDLCFEFDREMCESTPDCRCCNIMRIPKAEYRGDEQ